MSSNRNSSNPEGQGQGQGQDPGQGQQGPDPGLGQGQGWQETAPAPALSPRRPATGSTAFFLAHQHAAVQEQPGAAVASGSSQPPHLCLPREDDHNNNTINANNTTTATTTANSESTANSSKANLSTPDTPSCGSQGHDQAGRALLPSPPCSGTASFASFLPAAIRARLQSPPLARQSALDHKPNQSKHVAMGFTGEDRKTRRELAVETGAGAPHPQQAASEGIPSPETTPKRLVRDSTTAGTADVAPKSAGPATAPSRLSLLNMFSKPAAPAITPEVHEELLNMKVEEALFPAGQPTGKETFSPAAFKNLQAQATGLLTKMQTAYRQKAEALADAEKEREAEHEELEEAETRSKHLKFQLEDMAMKATEQERRMKQLMEELATERRARAELERVGGYSKQRLSPGAGLASEVGSTISEDLGVDEEEAQKRKWRKSNGTDTSFETDDDSISLEGESVFSRPRSPSVSTTTTTRGIETGSVLDMPLPTPSSMRGPNSAKRTSLQSNRPRSQMSTFQKLMKGISGEDGCRNCKGQDSSIAWDTVSLLRDENKNLKHRVGELEDCLEGALDAVNGIGL